MPPIPLPTAEQLKPWKDRLEAAGTTLRPLAARAETGVQRGLRTIAPYARRLDDRLRSVPVIDKTLDRVAGIWMRLVEAFCQTIEPMLARRFPEHRLIATADAAGGLALHRVGGDGVTALGELASMAPEVLGGLAATRWSAIELRLPATQVLERRLALPAASRDFLGPILEHRLDRLTPWRADKVLYGYRIAEDDAGAGSVSVAVTATSRDFVAAPLQNLSAAGLVPTAIGADAGAVDRPLVVNLLGGAAAPPRAESRRFVSRVALAAGGALVVVWLGTMGLASSANDDQAASTQHLSKARRLLRAATIGAVGSREQAMLEAKQPERSTMMLIDRLASAVPADTYLKELTVAPDKVRLLGSSGNAPALVGKLEAAGLRNVRFTSTIARGRDGRDEFELGADRPQPKAEDAP